MKKHREHKHEHRHEKRHGHECACGAPHGEPQAEPGCECECGCQCGDPQLALFQRHFWTKAEQIEELEAYLSELKQEILAVEELLADLRK